VSARFVRLAEADRPTFTIDVDGRAIPALEGDTVLTAMLTSGTYVRTSEFGPERRAGFCVMAACQDCWVWTADGARLRACSTPATPGLRLSTTAPDATWPNLA
jgi:predicted molibdopterin-dependent oxidoreductase YjgC